MEKDYTIDTTQVIGSGGCGKVYLGVRKSDNKQVAIKKIDREGLANFQIALIANEVDSLQRLKHSNIVRLYDYYEEPDCFYLCMELIRGGELFDRIGHKSYYSEGEARDVCVSILSAIKHCHDHDVVHRDLKPENFLLLSSSDDTALKLIDFGFSARTNGLTLTGILGTPNFMAPEIWRREKYGKPADMWAFGVIAYILLAGYMPFENPVQKELVIQICRGEFYFHEGYWDSVSEGAMNFITSLLTVSVNDRLTVEQAFEHPWVRNKFSFHFFSFFFFFFLFSLLL